MQTTLVVMAAVVTVVGLALLCGYLSGCTRGSLNEDPPTKPSNLH